MMAEAHGKLTGRPGVCFVTRGPGATNASIGVHIAHQDSTPMVMFVGLPAREHFEDREAFQDFDFTQHVPCHRQELGDRLRRQATAGISEPSLPQGNEAAGPRRSWSPSREDKPTPSSPMSSRRRWACPALAAPRAGDMDELQKLLAKSERPIVIAGGASWSAATRSELE